VFHSNRRLGADGAGGVRGAIDGREWQGAPVAAAEAGAENVLQQTGYVFVAPEILAAIAGVMRFLRPHLYAVLERIKRRPVACVRAAMATMPCGRSSASAPAGA